MSRTHRVVKRIADFVLVAASILVLSPLFLLTAIILKCTGEHLVIYRQLRVGKDYVPFHVLKFVTMRSNSEKSGTITTKNDSRVLPVGKVLRQTKINELLQLFNVLLGDMSIVGPRPLVASEVELYRPGIRELVYADNQPGLTGMGSLFFRNEEEIIDATGKSPKDAYKDDIMPIKGALEVWYREHKTLLIDLKICFLTAWVILTSRNDHAVKAFRNAGGMPPRLIEEYEALIARTLGKQGSST